MHQTLACVLLLLGFSAAFGKYVYVSKLKNWYQAQEYCRQHYTELAPISSTHDIELLYSLVNEIFHNYVGFWFGMKRGTRDSTKWFWSGAGEVTKFLWANGQPDAWAEDCGLLYKGWMHDAPSVMMTHFFCYKVSVVREKKTWEDAVDYCREHHHDLASVASEAEMTLIWKELGDNTTDHVWIGLHFFPGDWLWTDGQPTDYEAWSEEGKPGCPDVKFECAALRMREGMKSTNGTNSTLVSSMTRSFFPGVTIFGGNADVEKVEDEEKVWEAYDCEEKLFFVCY